MIFGIGIIGSGAIARVHATCIEMMPNIRFAGILSRNTTRAKILADTYNTVLFTEPEKFFNQKDLDIVCICNESGLHAENIQKAIKYNKHIVCEKPLDTSLYKIDAIIDQLNNHPIKLGVVFQNRMNPHYIELKNKVIRGELGDILLVNTEINWYRDTNYYEKNKWRGTLALDGGASLMNQGIHTLDLLIDLMGEIFQVSAQIETKQHNIEGEDLAVAHFKFKNNALGTLSAGTCLYPGHPESISIFGTKGSITFKGGQIRQCSLPDWQPTNKQEHHQNIRSAQITNNELHLAIFENFINAIIED